SQLIIMVPAMLSARGNISGSYSARVARDLIIGSARKNLPENVLSTVTLMLVTSVVIGFISSWIAFLLHETFLPVHYFFLLPLMTMGMTSAVSIPTSTSLNILAFKKGLNPSNVVPPIMTSIDDVLIVLNLFVAITILGVP
nr:magnesium transporter [Candidatus Sigynarchaeota archaeon]